MEHLGEDTAVDYLEGRLPEDQNRAWTQHLGKCKKCAQTLREWEEILDALKPSGLSGAPPEAVTNSIEIFPAQANPVETKAMFAGLVFDSLVQPAYSGLRGPSDARQVLLRTENLDIDLHVSSHAGQSVVWGQLLPRAEESGVSRVQVTLLCDGERIQSTRTNSSGEFRFEDVPDGELSIGVYLPSMSRQVFGVFKIQRN